MSVVTDFRARIGRVRMKGGGAELRILDRQPVNSDGDDWRGRIVTNAKHIAEQATDDAPLVGYLVVGMYSDGCSAVGFRWDATRCPIPRALMPAWVAEVVRRDMVTQPAAEDVFNEMFERIDGDDAS